MTIIWFGKATSSPSKWRVWMPQILANIAANLLTFDLCMAVSFPTVFIAATLHAKDGISINHEEASWLGSIAFILQPIGSIMSVFIVEFLGRKWSMIVVNAPFLAGWLLFYYANSVDMLFAANVVLGVGIGFMEAPIMTYLGETCQPELRDLITSFPNITCRTSVFLIYLMGNIVHWKTAAVIIAVIPIITILYVLMMPETPIYLLSRGRYHEAEKALCWFRGWVTPEVVKEEFNQLVMYSNSVNKIQFPVNSVSTKDTSLNEPDVNLEKGLQVKDQNNTQVDTGNEIDDKKDGRCSAKRWKEMLRPETRRPLLMILPCFFLLHCNGMSSIRPYMVHVFQEYGMKDFSGWCTVLSGVTSVLGGVGLFVLVHWVGKRNLSLWVMAGSGLSCLVIAIHDYLLQGPHGQLITPIPWVPTSMVISLSFFNSLYYYIPWNLLSEIFPFRTRGIASGFSSAMCYLFLFVASKTYLDLENGLYMYGTFFLFTLVNVLGYAFIYWKVPVTEGKSLIEIEQYFKGETKKL